MRYIDSKGSQGPADGLVVLTGPDAEARAKDGLGAVLGDSQGMVESVVLHRDVVLFSPETAEWMKIWSDNHGKGWEHTGSILARRSALRRLVDKIKRL